MKKYALFSVWDKTGILELASTLYKLGYYLLGTSSTASFLRENGIPCKSIYEITQFPEILDGRVKTLHPKIFGGILARSWNIEDTKTVKELGIPKIEFVVVNFYPFDKKKDEIKDVDRILEYIDIGGPSLARAAAKNFKDTTVLIEPEDYQTVIRELTEKGTVSEETRKKLAIKVFKKTAIYDTIISEYLESLVKDKDSFPVHFILPLEKEQDLRYGENPHQKASLYRRIGEANKPFELLLGRELSYNNIVDMYSAYSLVNEFDAPSCVIVKHTNPIGVSSGYDLIESYENALSTDTQSAFGGIVAFNDTVTAELAKLLNERFYEVIIAPDYTEDALSKLKIKKKRRVVRAPKIIKWPEFEIKNAFNRYLIQEYDQKLILNKDSLKIIPEGRKLGTLLMEDLMFAYKVVKYVKSNAIVVAKDKTTLGIGAGQMSRVKSVSLALRQAGEKAEGAVLASDGFFPFPDSIELAARYGISAIIQPGGSIRDKEVIEAAKKRGVIMVLTETRHFKH